jgi:hypothetical protein
VIDYSEDVRDLADRALRSGAGVALVRRAVDALPPGLENTKLVVDEQGRISVRAADPNTQIEAPQQLTDAFASLFLIAAQHLAAAAGELGVAVEQVPAEGVALLAQRLYGGGLTEPSAQQ